MRVLLKKSVPNIGRADQVVEVADAYARNFLLPKKLAVPATAGVIKRVQQQTEKAERERAEHSQALMEARQKLEGVSVTMPASASPSGRLFAAIKQADVLAALSKQAGSAVNGLRCMPDHLKTTGSHRVELVWPDGQRSSVTVEVTAG